MKKKVMHWLVNDGSPLNVTYKSIFGHDGRLGVGGAELALLTLCEGFEKRGYDVTLYNDPSEADASPFKQKGLSEFDPLENRDYLVVFRSPNERMYGAKGKRIWLSCDQHTVGDFRIFAKFVEKIVTISPFHSKYFKDMYGIEETIPIDLPVRVDDYEGHVEKVSKRCIYTSIPDRGALQLHAAWAQIVRDVPDASLVLTSDWRLWDANIEKSCLDPYRLPFAGLPNVNYMGAIKRDKLIGQQLQADVMLYPSVYPELFCIAVAEAQVAGAIPITSQAGAIETTNEFGIRIKGSAYEPDFIENFVKAAIGTLNDPYLKDRQIEMQEKAKERFSLDRILDEWESKVLNG